MSPVTILVYIIVAGKQQDQWANTINQANFFFEGEANKF
jgi:hypothetical protein